MTETADQALADAVDVARRRFVDANPESRRLFEAAAEVMPGGNTRTVLFHEPFPLRIAGGSGAGLRDADGHDYVDLLGDFTAGLFGHSEPAIAEAIADALANGLALSGHNLLESRLAAGICARFPAIDLVRFTNSGTEANLLALAVATAVTGRQKVLVFDGGYHGSLLSFGNGGSPVNVPHDWVVGRYNDIAGADALMAQHGPELAAVLVEPMLGAGGCVPGDPAFLAALRARSEQHGALLIVDEVMTSRLAPGGWAAELGIRPDLMTLGKYLGGGVSFGAFGGRRDVMDALDPRRPDSLPHAGTFNNNVLSMAAGSAALEVLQPEMIGELAQRGDRLRGALNELALAADVPITTSGIGSLMTVHFSTGPIRDASDVARSDPLLRELFHLDMLAAGFLLARRGMIALSLAVQDEHCDAFVHAVRRFTEQHGPVLRGLQQASQAAPARMMTMSIRL